MTSAPQDNEIRRVFDLMDIEKTGKVHITLLPSLIRAFGQNPTERDIQEYLVDSDKHHTGFVDYADFSKTLLKRWRDPSGEEEQIRQAFQRFDKDMTGFVNIKCVRSALAGYGDRLTDQEIRELMEVISLSGLQSGENVDYRELSRLLAGPN